MNSYNQSQAAQSFIKRWDSFNYKEKGNVGRFWIDLLEHVYGVNNGSEYIEREKSVPNLKGSTDYIDVYIPATKVLIEQKSPNIKLDQKEKRSFGMVTPFEQAKTYNDNLPWAEKARWIITCNFKEFWIYDMNQSGKKLKPTVIRLRDLQYYYYQLDFLIDPTRQDIKRETKVSVKACNIITKIYHNLLDQYSNQNDPQVLKDINKVCVRLVFCFYADDSGIFGSHGMFHNYMKHIPADLWRIVLRQLFQVLNQPENNRDSQLNSKLAAFPYVNGGMFADTKEEQVSIPRFTEDTKKLVMNAGTNFDWSQISPTIFGAMFESTLNPEERHINGMHYTSVQNIHKVIDPLFLNDLRHQLNVIKTKYKTHDAIVNHARAFQNKLASLTFLDPACGSGNFLTETYLCLRKLENEAIKLILGKNGIIQTGWALGQHLIKVSIHQFHGIEINDFAVSVAKTAMWIAESQMVQQTQNIIHQPITFLPLKTNPNIIEANALEMDWNSLIPAKKLDYIISNPPFAGDKKDKQQKKDMKLVMSKFKSVGKLDLVSAWYVKATIMIDGNNDIKVAMVSTNNITNGVQVALLWKPLINKYNIHINFAYRRFKWQNSAKKQAIVFCVIIGFSHNNSKDKFIVNEDGNKFNANNISPYLHNLPNIVVSSRNKPLYKTVPKMRSGSKPTDKGYLSRYSNEKKLTLCKRYPKINPLFKRITGANEFLKGKVRWCLWLENVDPKKWIHIKPVYDAIKKVKQYRYKSKDKNTRKSSLKPYLFQAIRQPSTDYLLIPSHTSKNRKYVPVGYVSRNIIVNNSSLYIPHATHYMFGIIESKLSTLWIALVSGRYGPSFRYSAKVTYNNFPWPNVTDHQKQVISKTAQEILNARKNHKGSSLADLYDPLAMPPDLQKAHKANDRAVLKAYDLKLNSTKNEVLTKLLKMYAELTK